MNPGRLQGRGVEDFGEVLDFLVPAFRSRRDRFVLLIDGGSGSGKTTLGIALQTGLCVLGQPAQLVSLDDCYPGWDGLAAASEMVARDILNPEVPGYRRWNWATSQPAEWVDIDPDRPLIVEGSGALTPESAAYATLSVWLERDADDRRQAALDRDGAAFIPHWDRWAAQERRHWSAHRPWELAGLVCVVAPR